MIEKFPETPGQLFDFLHERFGIGEYDDVANADTPWWKSRNTEIAKLKAMMRKRRVTEKHVAVAAWYAVSRGQPIRYYAQLFRLIPEAMREYKTAEQLTLRRNVRAGIEDAVAEALASGEAEWAERLMRAHQSEAPRLLKEWEASRG